MFLAEAVACTKVNRRKTARGPSSSRVGQSGAYGTTPTPCCRVISKFHHHSESSAIPAVLAKFEGALSQTTWSRGCHVSTELCVHLVPSFKLSLSWCLSNLLSSPLFLWLQPLILIFGYTLRTPSQALPPRSATFLALTYPPSDLHSSQCQEVGIGTLQIRLQKALFLVLYIKATYVLSLELTSVYFRAIHCSLINIHKHRNARWCRPATRSIKGVRTWPELIESHGRWVAGGGVQRAGLEASADCIASGPPTQGLKTETFPDVLLL